MRSKKQHGFSLIEVLVGLFLVVVAVLGLAHLFMLSVANNRNADRISTATNLAEQQVERLRSLTRDELLTAAGATSDEALDINQDGTDDYRRITVLDLGETDSVFRVSVYVYSGEKLSVPSPGTLIDNPNQYRPQAFLSTVITR